MYWRRSLKPPTATAADVHPCTLPHRLIDSLHHRMLFLLPAYSERAGWWGPSGAESTLSPWYGPDRNKVCQDCHVQCTLDIDSNDCS